MNFKQKHGHCTDGRHSRIYQVWGMMKDRCFNPNNPRYSDYGGRGITVCESWRHSFQSFYDDVGPRPSDTHSIERINNNGNYEPGNVRWATKEEQNFNRRNTHLVTIGGVTRSIGQWAKAVGLHRSVIGNRVKHGWPAELLLAPLRTKYRQMGRPKRRLDSIITEKEIDRFIESETRVQ
jgi:hypothetical protein